MQKMHAQEAEATRLREESAQFYRLARAAQERPLAAAPATAVAPQSLAEKRKQAPGPAKKPSFKVLKVQPRAVEASGTGTGAGVSLSGSAVRGDGRVEAPPAAPAAAKGTSCVLPGMGAYDNDSSSDDVDEDGGCELSSVSRADS